VQLLDALAKLKFPSSDTFDHNVLIAEKDTAKLTNKLWTLRLQHNDGSDSRNPNAIYSFLRNLSSRGKVWLASRRNDPANHVAIKLSLFQVCIIDSLLKSQYFDIYGITNKTQLPLTTLTQQYICTGSRLY
jgi:hypothetical protein